MAALLMVSFGLNWLWEMLQMPLYIGMVSRSWRSTIFVCALASLGDAFITFLIYGMGGFATRRMEWITEYGWKTYAVTGLAGAASGVMIESLALGTGRWAYTSEMPIVPVLRTGLWPLLQLGLLVPLALWIAAWLSKKYRPTNFSKRI